MKVFVIPVNIAGMRQHYRAVLGDIKNLIMKALNIFVISATFRLQQNSLKTQKKSIHEDVKHYCDQCDY